MISHFVATVPAVSGGDAGGHSIPVIAFPAWDPPLFWAGATLLVLSFASIVAWFAWRSRHLGRHSRAPADLMRQFLEREEAERKRVAHAIHDGVGHQLLELKNAATRALDGSVGAAELPALLERISALASAALESARDVAYRLRPFELDQLDLRTAIEALVGKVSQGTDLRVFKDLTGVPQHWTATRDLHLFRLVQEGLINVIRHADATTLLLEIRQEGDALTVKIEDDGRGFEVGAVGHGRGAGMGLARMEEHAKALGGELGISSAPGSGTRLRVKTPRLQSPAG